MSFAGLLQTDKSISELWPRIAISMVPVSWQPFCFSRVHLPFDHSICEDLNAFFTFAPFMHLIGLSKAMWSLTKWQ